MKPVKIKIGNIVFLNNNQFNIESGFQKRNHEYKQISKSRLEGIGDMQAYVHMIQTIQSKVKVLGYRYTYIYIYINVPLSC